MNAPEVDPAAVETLAELLHETVRDFHGGLSWGELGDFAKGDYRMRATAAYPLLVAEKDAEIEHQRTERYALVDELANARTTWRKALDLTVAERDEARAAVDAAVAERLADERLIYEAAKASWDRGERDYWDSESDMRPFDPSVTELDSDDCDRGHEWLGIVTEVVGDLRAALSTAKEASDV